MALLLYILTALGLLALMHKFVCRLSRGAAALLFFIPFLFVGPALVTGRVYAPIDRLYQEEPFRALREPHGISERTHNPVTTDIFSQMIPWRAAVRASYARGEWPLWNPSILCGDVLAAAAQPAAYSPFTLLALLLPVGVSFTFT
ncbi:MAG TPA: hypothetical protein VJZ00_16030, partial [Thermoanaerobaculia bacterium]|nr:hypothetical protein [Thermoanaerobaculia bacterium]